MTFAITNNIKSKAVPFALTILMVVIFAVFISKLDDKLITVRH